MADVEAWPDIAGRIEDKTHILPVRVYYEDTDFSGVVYHASYLRFCERGRSDFMRLIGVHHAQMFDAQNEDPTTRAFAVRHMEIDFLGAAKIDDVVLVQTTVLAMTGVRLKLEQNISCQDKLLLKAAVTVVVLDENGKPRRFPNTLLTNLEAYMS